MWRYYLMSSICSKTLSNTATSTELSGKGQRVRSKLSKGISGEAFARLSRGPRTTSAPITYACGKVVLKSASKKPEEQPISRITDDVSDEYLATCEMA